MRKLAVLSMVVAAVAVFPCLASAQNFYAAIRGGPGFTPDVKIGPPGTDEPISFAMGFTGSGAVGYASSFGLRLEGEFGYIYAPVDREEGFSVTGSVKSYLMMANLYYDLKTPSLGPWKPYIGVGIGAARVNEDREGIAFEATRITIDKWRTAFAYQGRLGVGYDVNKWLDLSLGYRYVHIDSGNRDGVLPGFTVRSEALRNHSVELGAAFKF